MDSKKIFKKTLIIGLGLIGGSFAKAIYQAKISGEIFACDPDLETIELAKADGIIKYGFESLDFLIDEISSFDFIVVATPLSEYEEIFNEIRNSKALVIDLGSIKNFLESFRPKLQIPKNFIPCHPVAGSENDGFENSKHDLFRDKKFIICKQNKVVEEIAKRIGAKPELLEPKKHDEIYALVSHLPQFLSFLTKEFSPKRISDQFFKTAFRLDNSSSEIWNDIFTLNKNNLEKFYVRFFDNLKKNINSIHSPQSISHQHSVSIEFDEKFFEENFAKIFFRTLVVKSYLEIPEIEKFKSYAGSGFLDFTSIISILGINAEKLPAKLTELITKNQKEITKLFNTIST